MLCTTCAGYRIRSGRGQCQGCANNTNSPSYRYCDQCSLIKGLCLSCGVQLGPPLAPNQKTRRMVKKSDPDNGGRAYLGVGEDLHITLDEDQSTGLYWTGKSWNQALVLWVDGGVFVPDPSNNQFGARTLIFRANRKGRTKLELRQVNQWNGAAGSQSWSITIMIK